MKALALDLVRLANHTVLDDRGGLPQSSRPSPAKRSQLVHHGLRAKVALLMSDLEKASSIFDRRIPQFRDLWD
jgi:hypothetical protein